MIFQSVLVSTLSLIWLRNVVALRLILHSLTHMNLLLMSCHCVMVVHHSIQMTMRRITLIRHQRW